MNARISYGRFLLLLGSLSIFSVSCALLETPAPGPTPTALAFPSVVPSNNATTFDVDSLISQPAWSFTLPDANGQPYNFQPNDGRKHLVVFYMVYT